MDILLLLVMTERINLQVFKEMPFTLQRWEGEKHMSVSALDMVHSLLTQVVKQDSATGRLDIASASDMNQSLQF